MVYMIAIRNNAVVVGYYGFVVFLYGGEGSVVVRQHSTVPKMGVGGKPDFHWVLGFVAIFYSERGLCYAWGYAERVIVP